MRYSTWVDSDEGDDIWGFEPRTPHVLKRTCDEGLFGRVKVTTPTESRPCHVAMFAGFREDPANLYTGWKANARPFDSVFNRTSKAFLFGSVDIIELFDKADHVKSFTYNLNYPKSPQKDKAYLDQWVLKTFKQFIYDQKTDQISGENEIFLFHLMGADTNGHKHGAESSYYRHNAAVADSIIQEIETLFGVYYTGSTSFIVTADHGHTDTGGHGSDSTEETTVPFAAWGPAFTTHHRRAADLCAYGEWAKEDIVIEQTNIAPLISATLANQSPSNSRSALRSDLLDASVDQKALMVKANIEQMDKIKSVAKYEAVSSEQLDEVQIHVASDIIAHFRVKKLSLSFILASLFAVAAFEPRATKDFNLRTMFEAYFVTSTLSILLLHYHQAIIPVVLYYNWDHFSPRQQIQNRLRFASAWAFTIATLVEDGNDNFKNIAAFVSCLYPCKQIAEMALSNHGRRHVQISLFLLALCLLTCSVEFIMEKEASSLYKSSFRNLIFVLFICAHFIPSSNNNAHVSLIILGLSLTLLMNSEVWFYLGFNSFVLSPSQNDHCIMIAGKLILVALGSFFGTVKLVDINTFFKDYEFALIKTLVFGLVPLKLMARGIDVKSIGFINGYILRISCLMVSITSLFLITHGSWLEVGLSISRLAICTLISPVISLLLYIAK